MVVGAGVVVVVVVVVGAGVVVVVVGAVLSLWCFDDPNSTVSVQ